MRRTLIATLLVLVVQVPAAHACITIYVTVTIAARNPTVDPGAVASHAHVRCTDYFGNGWVSYMQLNHWILEDGRTVDERTVYDDTDEWISNISYWGSVGKCYRARASGDDRLGTRQEAGSSQVCLVAPPPPPVPIERHYIMEPLILDLAGDGIRTTRLEDDPVVFDLSGNGISDLVAWTERQSDDAFLYIDLNQNGIIDGGQELFGDATLLPDGTRARAGFEALAVYDSDGDGSISPRDGAWGKLRLWTDSDHDGLARNDENGSLAASGVVSLPLTYRELGPDQEFGADANGNRHFQQGAFRQRSRSGVVERALHCVAFRGVFR